MMPQSPRNGPSHVTPSSEGTSALENLIEDCTDRLQAGEAIDVEELARHHPEHGERLRRLLPSLAMMAEVGRSAAPPREGGAARTDALEPPHSGPFELGDYRVLHIVGRGGMGIVYEAIQVSLNRRVALKVLPFAAALDPHQLRRFQTEAQAAAQLHHTNIVPVFAVGCERGVHFYAMQFIEGRTLAVLIQERRNVSEPARGSNRPSSDREYVRSVARLGIQAAEALDHAHHQGIIHRDIKPANLLVDVHGNLWITDFGLARFLNESGMTLTGDLIGTLRYMSPEQALAKRLILDHRTDIYSLGATLYELLTLHPVVDGRDRQEVLRRIADEESIPPRRIDPTIPRDLETILLKALAKEPEARYATARDLADDLRRFLEHRPIKAQRPNLLERATKWARRHPALVASVVSVLALAVIGLSLSLVAVNRERSRTAGKAREVAEKSREVERLARRLEWELYVSRVNQAQGDYQAGNTLRAESTLAACPNLLRNWEWRYVERLCHLERYAVHAHTLPDGVDQLPVLFTPDGKSWISGAGNTNLAHRNGAMKLWDTATGRCLADLASEGLPGVLSLAVSPDGRLVAVGFVDTGIPTQLRETATGRLVGVLTASRDWGQPRDLAFSPDNCRLADVRDSGRLVLWDVASGKALRSVSAHPTYAFAVAFHPDGKLVASAGKDGAVRLWDSNTGALIQTLQGHEGAVFDLSFAPDHRRLASAGWDQTVRIWDLESGRLILAIPCQAGFVNRVAFSPRGDRLASSSGHTVTIWDASNGRELFTVRGQNHFGTGLDFTPDGTCFLTSSLDGMVRLWEAAGTAPRILKTEGWINQLAFSAASARLVAADTGGVVELWDAATGQALHVMKGHDDSVRSATFAPDGSWIVSASWDGSAGLWDTATGREIKTLIAPNRPKHGRRQVYLNPQRGSSISQGALSPDGSRLATGGWDWMVHVWDLPSGVERMRYAAHRAIVWSVAYSPDGRKIASAGADRTVRVWDSQTGRDLWTAVAALSEASTIQRQMLAFSPDSRLLAACVGYEARGPFAVQLWDAATGTAVRTLTDPGSQINAVAFLPDGSRIATACEDRTVKLWDTDTGQNVFVLRGHTASVLAVAFSPDGHKLASGSVDATVRIWDAP
ncbi:MAG: protein kinase [Isosphaerales bacterium]